MAATQTPFGLKPVNLIGGQAFNGGTIREYKLNANVSTAFYTGALMVMAATGLVTPVAASPVAPDYQATSTPGTAGILGVCVGVRYVSPATQQTLYAQYLPANAITSGYTEVYIRVNDDPDQLYSIQADTAVGSRTYGAIGTIGQNAAVKTFTGNNTTGLSQTALDTGTNWGSCAATTTLAMRIVDIITPTDTYPEVLVKLNFGVHSYMNPLGVATS